MPNHKRWIEVVLMPLVIALVGISGTYFITDRQQKDTTTKSAVDRQIKILEIFSAKITSTEEKERILALRLLRAIDSELAEKLARAVSETEPEQSPVKQIANQVAEEAEARSRLLPRIYIHIRAEEDRPLARVVAEKLKQANFGHCSKGSVSCVSPARLV